MKNITICILLIMMVFSAFAQNDQQTSEAPNVIIIFPDQYRQYSLSFWSQGDNAKLLQGNPDPVSTPALDKLANEGVVFNRAISNFPLCSPYRGMLLTGLYPFENGVIGNCHKTKDFGVKADGKAIANVYSEEGYETAYFGKCHWHRTEPVFDANGTYQGTTNDPGGHYINSYDTYVPSGVSRLGFNYFFQTLRDTHFDPLCYSNDPKAINNLKDGELYQPKRFNAELEAEVLLDYLDNTHNQRDTNKPFFITWSLNPPHNPWNDASTDMRFFPQYTEEGTVNIDKLLLRENADKVKGEYAPYYFANVSAVDHYIGKVLDKLEEMGVTDNTIIIFTSDHGEMLGSHGYSGKLKPLTESLNVPFIIKWGDRLDHRIEDLMLSVPDIMPTLLALSGFEDKIPSTVQGTNFADNLLNPTTTNVKEPEEALYLDYKSRGLYTGDYTFVVKAGNNNTVEEAYCYDNINDPYQLHKILATEMEEDQLSEFKRKLVSHLIEIDDKWAQDQKCSGFLNYVTDIELTDIDGEYGYYPNPFTSSVTVNTGEGITRVNLLDIWGRAVASQTTAGGTNVTLAPSYSVAPVGLYILKLEGKKDVRSDKIIRQ